MAQPTAAEPMMGAAGSNKNNSKNSEDTEQSQGAAASDFFGHIGVCETLGRSARILRRQWKTLLSITAVAYLIMYALKWITLLAFVGFNDSEYLTADNRQGLIWHTSGSASGLILLESLLFYVIMCVADGAVIRAVAQVYVGYTPTAMQAGKAGLTRVGPLCCSCLLIGLVSLGTFLVIVGLAFSVSMGISNSQFLYFWYMVVALITWSTMVFIVVATYHTYPAIMIENHDAVGSIKRSLDLSKNHRWYIFCILAIFGLIKFATGLFFTSLGYASDIGGGGFGYSTEQAIDNTAYEAVDDAVQYGDDAAGNAAGYQSVAAGVDFYIVQFIQTILTIVFACYGAVLQAVVYVSVRSNKEGLNTNTLSQDIGMSDGEQAAYEMMSSGNEKEASSGDTAEVKLPSVV